MEQASTFDQHNKHHTQLLGGHLNSTYKKVLEEMPGNIILMHAALYHDIGKLWAQTYKERDPDAHYYQHANVGAYKLLCYTGIHYSETGLFGEGDLENYSLVATLNSIFYVNYHMEMYGLKTEKAINRWKNIFGEEKFYYLTVLNSADKNSNSHKREDFE